MWPRLCPLHEWIELHRCIYNIQLYAPVCILFTIPSACALIVAPFSIKINVQMKLLVTPQYMFILLILSDVDECKFSNECQQVCINTNGSYFCACNVGFQLSSDQQSCMGMSLHVPTGIVNYCSTFIY